MKHKKCKYHICQGNKPSSRLLKVCLLLVIILSLFGVSAFVVHKYYENSLKPVSNSSQTVQIVIASGTLAPEIASNLHKAGLIRSEPAFLWYIKMKNASNKILAGTYRLQPNLSTQQIVEIMTEGKVATDLVTILPGQRLDQIRQSLIKSGFSEESVDRALDPNLYKGNPALSSKPVSASLEGYLYPDSFLRDASTQPEDIIRGSLAQMDKALTPQIKAAFEAKGLSVYQGITLASMVEMEGYRQSDRDQIAQVFLSRISVGMKLESDPTAHYGAILQGKERSVLVSSPYNTYEISGLPPGPISNVSQSSLNAVATPASSSWLFFVAGDDGQTHFSKTLQEHESLVEKYCTIQCGN